MAVGSNTWVDGKNSVSVGSNNHVVSNSSFVLGNNVEAKYDNNVILGDSSTDRKYKQETHGVVGNLVVDNFAGTASGVVSVGAVGKERQIVNVAAGEISSTSTNAINGSQLYSVAKSVDNVGNSVVNIVGGNTTIDNHGNITTNNIGNTGKDTIHDAIDSIRNKSVTEINTVNARMNKVGASVAALAGLHPLDYNPELKWDVAASFGHYENANAVALGAYYRPNENVIFSLGASLGSETMINAGVSYKIGSHDTERRNYKLKKMYDSRIVELENEVAELKAQVKELVNIINEKVK